MRRLSIFYLFGFNVLKEILKVICRNDAPFLNTFLFNALDGSGTVVHNFSPL